MTAEANAHIRADVIVHARLDYLWPIVFQSVRGFLRRAHDGDVPGNVRVRIGEDDYNQIALIRQRLRPLHAGYPPPSLVLRGCAVEPVCLGIGQQQLPVLRRPEKVYA